MKYCPNPECEKAVPESAQHCPHCGQTLTTKNIPATPFYVAGVTFITIAVILFVRTIQPKTGKDIAPKAITSTPVTQPTSPQPTLTKRVVSETPTGFTEPDPSATMTISGSCPGAPNPRIFINALVRVVTTDNDRVVLRSSPTIKDSTELQRLSTGTQLKIHDGPVCVNDASTGINYWFWEVKVKSNGRMGWVAEGDRSLYYLQLAR